MQTVLVAEAEKHQLSVAELIREAMETSYQARRPSIETPGDLPSPLPHLPLRKASVKKLQRKRSAPRPLWAAPQHQVRGFNPSPVQAVPHIDNVTASSEHAFAGKDENRRRPFKPPLGVQVIKQGYETQTQYAERPSPNRGDVDGRPPSSPLLPPPASPRGKGLRSSKSLGGLKGWKHRFSSPVRGAIPADRDTVYSVPVQPGLATQRGRDSCRSAVTSNSSFLHTSSVNTEHSSLTGNSSNSDFVQVYPNWPQTEETGTDHDMTVEDAIGMYADGFSSAKQSLDTLGKRSFQGVGPHSSGSSRGDRPLSQPAEKPEELKRPNYAHRRSQSASLLDRVQTYPGDSLAPPKASEADHKRTFTKILAGPATQNGGTTNMQASQVPRDRYGFKKASHYITVEQHDAWNVHYSEHLERRCKKWHALMKSYGLNTDKPFRFPPKSDKIKRYVRKGIPPEFRGAAWFWYAGGPGKLAKEPGLYWELVERARNGKLSDNDREHIERDLNRTFPDNIRFKPDPTTTLDAQAGAGGGAGKKKGSRYSDDPETPILQALRRVLQAFAVHNPTIGYCQSLNFIAGLLLLFLDEDEEKTFILLNIVTTTHLPGTHGVALEGANIDIAVLMSCIRDSLPAIWTRLDDKGGALAPPFPSASAQVQALRLPTVSLATTAWFMSLFVGTLPIESVLRVWDCLFFEGSKTLFRIALAIFKRGEPQILAVSDAMEIFQVVQTIPRGMLDVNGLMEVCFRRRGGFGHVSQGLIEGRREDRRQAVRDGVNTLEGRSGWRGRLMGRTKT